MSKVCKLIIGLLLGLHFVILMPVYANDLQINDFSSDINHQFNDRVRLSMTWTTKKPMTSLEIRVILENGTIQAPFNWSRSEGKSNSNCIWYNDSTPRDDDKYHYFLEFYIETNQKGTLYLEWRYQLDETLYSHPVYIATGNPTVKEEDYSPKAALMIGFYTTIGASLGTYFLIKVSQKSTIIDKENEDELS